MSLHNRAIIGRSRADVIDESEKLVDKVHVLLLGMEERMDKRFDAVDKRFEGMDERFNMVDIHLDSLTRELKLNNELVSPFVHWSHNIEEQVARLSAQLQDVQARLKKLENSEPII